jgi:hypothetical protein
MKNIDKSGIQIKEYYLFFITNMIAVGDMPITWHPRGSELQF